VHKDNCPLLSRELYFITISPKVASRTNRALRASAMTAALPEESDRTGHVAGTIFPAWIYLF
jgi:hypothetical protein